jgi:DNA-binding Lrp family transcriptional regulator
MTGPPNQVGAGGVAAPPEPNASLASDDETVPNGVWCHAVGVVLAHRPAGMSDGDWLLLIQLSWFANPDGTNITAEIRTLAARLGKSPATIGVAMRRLVAAGPIVRTGGGPRQRTTYALAVGPWKHRARTSAAIADRDQAVQAVERRAEQEAERAHVRAVPRADLEKAVRAVPRADVRAVPRADLPDHPPSDSGSGTNGFAREATDELGRSDPVPFEQTATNLHGVALARLRLHPAGINALLEMIRVTLLRTGPPDSGEMPDYLSITTNRAGPADRRRRSRVSA